MTSSSPGFRLWGLVSPVWFFCGSHLSFLRLEPNSLSLGFSLSGDWANKLALSRLKPMMTIVNKEKCKLARMERSFSNNPEYNIQPLHWDRRRLACTLLVVEVFMNTQCG